MNNRPTGSNKFTINLRQNPSTRRIPSPLNNNGESDDSSTQHSSLRPTNPTLLRGAPQLHSAKVLRMGDAAKPNTPLTVACNVPPPPPSQDNTNRRGYQNNANNRQSMSSVKQTTSTKATSHTQSQYSKVGSVQQQQHLSRNGYSSESNTTTPSLIPPPQQTSSDAEQLRIMADQLRGTYAKHMELKNAFDHVPYRPPQHFTTPKRNNVKTDSERMELQRMTEVQEEAEQFVAETPPDSVNERSNEEVLPPEPQKPPRKSTKPSKKPAGNSDERKKNSAKPESGEKPVQEKKKSKEKRSQQPHSTNSGRKNRKNAEKFVAREPKSTQLSGSGARKRKPSAKPSKA